MKTIKIALYIPVIAFAALSAGAQTPTTFGLPTYTIDEPTFGRYASGWECTRVSGWSENRFWRDKRPDTIYRARTGNPTQRSSVANVRKCLAKFNLSSTAQRDILGLMEALVDAEQSTQVDAAAAKLASTAATMPVSAKAWILYQISNVYIGAAQPKLPQAQKYIAQLDAMGAAAAPERMLAHKDLADAARFRDSIPLWDKELAAALAASKQMTGDTRKEYAYVSANIYLGIADLKGRVNDPQSAIKAIETARAELIPLRASIAQYLKGAERPYTLMGQSAPPVQATKWFNTNGSNIHPAPGKPALLVHVSKNCGSYCYTSYSVLRRLVTKFESQGLDVVLMTRTSGYHRNRLVRPDSEIVFVDDYFTNFLKFPLNLAVWQVPFGKRDDGKLTILSAPNNEAYPGSAFIIDSKGAIRLATELVPANEAILEDVLSEQFGPPAPR